MNACGVTIGVGEPYTKLAHLAAACFEANTGLPVKILDEKDFKLSRFVHPAALKMSLFNHVDAETVIYFDADWLCLDAWDIRPLLSDTRIYACRDFILRDEWPDQTYCFQSRAFLDAPKANDVDLNRLRDDYIRDVANFATITLSPCLWINTGLLVIKKKEHSSWLSVAQELYNNRVGHHEQYFEQPAMIKALELEKPSITLLARNLNVLAAFEGIWPSSVKGLHIKLKRHKRFLGKVIDGDIATPDATKQYFAMNTQYHG